MSQREPVDAQVMGAARHEVVARMMESLMHEARNPLNALSINLGVLAQKLRGADGLVPATQEKNLQAMREQVARVDDILKLFADFMALKVSGADGDFSHAVERAVAALGHEGRRAQVRFKTQVTPNLKVPAADAASLYFMALQPLLRAVARSEAGTEVAISLTRESDRSLLRVLDGGGKGGVEPFPNAVPALRFLARQWHGDVHVSHGELELTLPLNPAGG